jgi:hypothetical protein
LKMLVEGTMVLNQSSRLGKDLCIDGLEQYGFRSSSNHIGAMDEPPR